MNLPQRIVLLLAFVIVLVTALFPHWTYVLSDEGRHLNAERPAGYHLIFGEHVPPDESRLWELFGLRRGPYTVKGQSEQFPDYITIDARLSSFSMRIDGTRLTIQLAATILLTSILYLALRVRK
jgi:hypothetical protein